MNSKIRYRHTITFVLIWTIFSVNGENISVSKCCPQGQVLTKGCTPSENPLVNPYKPSNGQNSIHRTLKCDEEGSYFLDPDENEEDEYHLLHNSSILLVGKHEVLSPEHYCMEFITSINKIRPLLCFGDEEELPVDELIDGQAMRMYSLVMFISAPFLIATFLIYVFIRELRTLHGKCLCSHIFALFMSYVCLASLQQFTTSISITMCTITGFSVQYFFLATFFWLNVMCIDIYWAFSSVRSRGSRPGGGDTRKLLLYSLYAWGMPMLILLITVAVDVTDIVPNSSQFKPKVGVNKCFFDGRTSAYTYFYGPMAILLCVNMVLFGITAYRIWRTSKETASLNRGDSRRHSDKQENERFKLYMKLFLVMGINWVAELISFIVGEKVPHYLWYVTDLTNTLQGVFIFIIFVWKRRVRRLIWDRICMLTGRRRISRSRGGTSSDATTTTSINNTAVSQLRLNSVGLVK